MTRAWPALVCIAGALALTACGSSPPAAQPRPSLTSLPAPSTAPASTPQTTPSPAPSTTPPAKRYQRVELWGDSLAAQVAPLWLAAVGRNGFTTGRTHTFPGTALCDWLADMRNETNPAAPDAFRPQAAVLAFYGGSFTPCVRDAAGAPLKGAALVDKYSRDVAAAIDILTAAGVDVYVASAPLSREQSRTYTGLSPLGRMFSQLPARYRGNPRVHYVDAASPLQRNGKFTLTLPCRSGEVCTGRWPDGTPTVVVRQSDGVHFCPVPETTQPDGSRTCPSVMPGGQRYAEALAAPVSGGS